MARTMGAGPARNRAMTTEPIAPQRDSGGGEASAVLDYEGLRHDIGFVLRASLRHRRLAAACFVAVALAAAASALVFRDIYQVQAEILALRNPVMSTLSNPSLARGADWDAPTRAARETILRRDNLISLIRQTDFVDNFLRTRSTLGRLRAWFFAKLTGHAASREEIADALADTLERKLWVNVSTEGTVTVVFEWPDREIAYQIVEAAVQNFLEARHASESAVLGEAVALLEVRASKLQRELDTTLMEVERKERSRPRVGPRRPAAAAPVVVRPDEDLTRLESTLHARRRALADLEEFRQRRLAELQAQLVQREATFAERHPEVVATRQSIAALAQPSPQIEALRAEVRDLEREVASRGGAPGTAASAPPTLPAELLQPRSLFEADDVRDVYDRGRLRLLFDQYSSLEVRLEAARAEQETAQAAFKYRYTVTSPPMIPKTPKKPYLLLRTLAGLFGGIALALFVTTAVDIRSGRVLEPWQVERQLALPILAHFRG